MSVPCPSCGERGPDSAFFCIDCGAVVAPGPHRPVIRPILQSGAPRPRERLRSHPTALPRDAPRSQLAPLPSSGPPPAEEPPPDLALGARVWVPLIGFLYAILFLVGLKLYLTSGGLQGLGMLQIALLVFGALAAQQAWVNGQLWSGLRGMLLWCGTIWLLAAGRVIPWVPLLFVIWLLSRTLPLAIRPRTLIKPEGTNA